MTYRDDPWMAGCADRSCSACGKNDGTVVAAHANEQRFGKGMGIKAASWTCVPLCAEHHFWLDHVATREEARDAWLKWWTSHAMASCESGSWMPATFKEREKRPAKLLKIVPRNDRPWPPRAA